MKIFNPLKWYKEKEEAKKRQAEILTRLLNDYQELINEYRLIQEKKSTLSRKERDWVVLRIRHLISKGHIQVSS